MGLTRLGVGGGSFSLIIKRKGVTRLQLEVVTSKCQELPLTSLSFAICSPKVELNINAESFYIRVAILLPSAMRWEEHVTENQLSESAKDKIRQPLIRSSRLTK
jgi:hypothetical protein